MSKFLKYTLLAIGLNLLSFIIFFIPLFNSNNVHGDAIGAILLAFILILVSFLTQVVVALTFLTTEKRKQIGKAMLLSIGILLLIGLSFCGIAINI